MLSSKIGPTGRSGRLKIENSCHTGVQSLLLSRLMRVDQRTYLLKKVLARYVPESLSERPKMGFGVPIDQWFRGELNPLLMDYLSPERLRRQGIFNPVLVEKKIKEHLSGKRNHQYRLWAILMWEMWREQWIG